MFNKFYLYPEITTGIKVKFQVYLQLSVGLSLKDVILFPKTIHLIDVKM